MKPISLFTALLLTSHVYATQPLLQYAWHNQTGESQLIIFDDGAVSHHERQMYELHKIPENRLSGSRLERVKALVAEIADSKSDQFMVDTATGSLSGTLEVNRSNGMVIVEGIIRDIHDPFRGKAYKSRSDKIDELKEIIFQYTNLDMDL